MKHRRPGTFILLASCSYCKDDFQDGAARHLLGNYPMVQFCNYSCAEMYLENSRGIKPAITISTAVNTKDTLRHQE